MLEEINAKTIILKQKHPEYWFNSEYNMNLYKGCVHGCIYCDSRSDCYHIKNFDQLYVKKNALAILEEELKKKRDKGVIGTGAMSDPYNPYENKYKITRGALQLINRYGFGVNICTKSDLVIRDIDLLKDIQKKSMVCVNITITASDDETCKKIEPNVVCSSKRFAALKKLSEQQIYCGILMMPLLPYITGNADNVKSIVSKAASSGASFIYPSFGVTMREGNREYLYKQFDEFYPGLKEKYMKLYGNQYMCTIPDSEKISEIFIIECKKHNILYKMNDIINKAKDQVTRKQIKFF